MANSFKITILAKRGGVGPACSFTFAMPRDLWQMSRKPY
ncbi:hypothetical protein Y033_5746 [Burkholderia pseudomallei MSHR435]|nr:hypothetical protein Y033_5746 [Burkholderia pseudomallei MSHR435]